MQNIQKILDSIYLIPILIDHIKQPTSNTTKFLATQGIDAQDVENCKQLLPLLEYHQFAVQNSFKPNYPLLRDGLEVYFQKYLSDFIRLIGLVNRRDNVLDYGCGMGQIGRKIKELNPDANVLMVDREKFADDIMPVDFEADPSWYTPLEDSMDYIILSEVLHCKDIKGQEYLIKSSHKMLKSLGVLVIIENVDYAMAYRISKIKGKEFNVVDDAQIKYLTDYYFRKLHTFNINRHNIYLYAKV